MGDEVDNPFRPGSELSREADIIVNMIKEGKPITPTMDSELSNGRGVHETSASPTKSSLLLLSSSEKPEPGGVVEVQHGIIVPPNDKMHVEEVTLKKKKKCCSVQ